MSPEPLVHFGSPAESILQIASEHNSDVIVLGVRPEVGHLGAATHLPWTTARQVLARRLPGVDRAGLTLHGGMPHPPQVLGVMGHCAVRF